MRTNVALTDNYADKLQVYNLTGPRAGQETGFPTVNNFYILSKGIELGQRNGKLHVSLASNLRHSGN